MHMLKKFFHNKSIAKQVLAILVLVSILPIAIIQVLFSTVYIQRLETQTRQLSLLSLQQSSRNAEEFFTACDHIIMSIYTDQDYVQNINDINLWSSRRYHAAKHQVIQSLRKLAYTSSDLLGVAIISANGEAVFYDTVTSSGTTSYCFDMDRLQKSMIISSAQESKSTTYSNTMLKQDAQYGDNHYFYITHHLTDFSASTKGMQGSIVLCVDEKAFRTTYPAYTPQSTAITFVVDENGSILSFPLEEHIGSSLGESELDIDQLGPLSRQFLLENGLMQSDNIQVNVQPIRNGKLFVVNAQDINATFRGVRFISTIVLLVGLLTFTVCCMVALGFSANMDKSVQKILTAMDRMSQGDSGAKIQVEGQDEFAEIGRNFNHMMDKIQQSNEQERRAMLQTKNAEITALEAQINPHFLYNTLDTINWEAIEKEQFHISKMLSALAVILRYNVNKSNAVVSVREELFHLRKYIYLQQQRFQYSIQCVIHAEPQVMDWSIHKLLVQPLIENAIQHGFPGKTGSDQIEITLRATRDDHLEIRVADNGVGMPPQLVDQLNHYDFRQAEPQASIGVRNVITRMQLYYGDESRFHIQSSQAGTCVTMVIPQGGAREEGKV